MLGNRFLLKNDKNGIKKYPISVLKVKIIIIYLFSQSE